MEIESRHWAKFSAGRSQSALMMSAKLNLSSAEGLAPLLSCVQPQLRALGLLTELQG